MQTQQTQDFLLKEIREITKKTMQDPNFKKIHSTVKGQDKYNKLADIDPEEYRDDDCENYASMAVGFRIK